MKRFIVFVVTVAFFGTFVLTGNLSASDEDMTAGGLVIVNAQLPPEAMEMSERKLRAFLQNLIPPDFSVVKTSGETMVLRGPESRLGALEERGLSIGETLPLTGAARRPVKQVKRNGSGSLSFNQNWGPLEFPGEIVTAVEDYMMIAEDAIVVGTRNSDWTQGKVYFYDWQGNLQWSYPLSRGVSDVYTAFSNEIILVTQNSSTTQGGVYVYDQGGSLLGSWNSDTCGIDYIYYYYDLDDDGTYEIVVRPEDYNTFYVLSHTGNLEWQGVVTDNIANMSFQDLYGNGKREVIVFSRNTTIPRGQITVFDPDTHSSLGSRDYVAADLNYTYSPFSASYEDLDGDGTEEIIPNPWYLNQKMEILSDGCTILDTENLGRDVSNFYTYQDFNGDGRNDIALMTHTWSPDTIKVKGYLGFNGSGFDSTWNYPTTGTINKFCGVWDIDNNRIAFGTEDTTTFSGCRVYLLNASDGTEWASPVAVSGSVDDVINHDLNNDGSEEVAVLANNYSDPTHTWTFYVYDQNLNLLVPGGHFSYQSDTGKSYSSCWFSTADLDGDNVEELIPNSYGYLGNAAPVVAYTGVLKWSYNAPEQLTDLDYYYDIDGDGNDDLVVISGVTGSGHIAILKDQGASYGLIGERAFPDKVTGVSYHDFDDDNREEIMPRIDNSLGRSIYSYNLSDCYWDFTPSGDEVRAMDYYQDLDENGIDDVILASNDTAGNKGYVYVFFGGSQPTSVIIDSGDYNGDGTSDIAIFREGSGLWAVRGVTRVYFGGSADNTVPGDYDGDGTTDIGIFRSASGLWVIRNVTRAYFGSSSDIPIPGDYDGDGTADVGIFRGASGLWLVRGVTRVYFGGSSDEPVPGYYNGDGAKDIGIFRPTSGLWALRGISRIYFGGSSDMVVPGDYNGDGTWEAGIFRSSSGLWAIKEITRSYFGSASDQPVPADFDGDSIDDLGIFRANSGLWAVRGFTRTYFGGSSDIPVTR